MKNLLILILTALLFASCESLETNNPAMQGSVDHAFFKADYTIATQNNDSSYLIQGVTQTETMTLKIANNIVGTYVINGVYGNYATFENSAGSIYKTDPEGSGKIIVTSLDPVRNIMTGTFNFTAMVNGVDTIRVHNGVFYEVHYTGDDGGGVGPFDGTISASIDESPFNPINVIADEVGDSIVIVGISANASRSISIKVPIDVGAGFFELPENGFLVSYTLNSVEEDALSGTIVINTHNTAAKTLSGTFSFVTENHTIEEGQFNVTYQ